MRTSRIRQKLAADEPVLVTTLHLMDECVFEMVSLMGFDGIWIDLEHHGHSVETAARMMRAARVGSADIVARPAKGELMRMGRLLEAGAQVIMYPQCDDANEAEDVVRWAKFPPVGRRGYDGGNPDMPYLSMPFREYTEQANRETVIIIQIETAAALDDVEQIAALPGVDLLMVGPADLSQHLGVPGEFDHPRLAEAYRRVAAAAEQTGKAWGRPVFSPGDAQQLLDQGGRFLCYSADIVLIKTGYETIQRDFASLGFSFGG